MVNTNKYSSPVPLVGLYIAAASLVCFCLILCDVWVSFRRKKYWFPCRFFSINSITLTLISIAAKIPIDLTTEMPSKQDQLSKLCGTVFICVTMIFMLPSVATNAEFESYANVTALSIFVITVLVNICVQMVTGVIFSFIVEHVMILMCILLLLLRFWFLVTTLSILKGDNTDKGRDLIRNGEGNMLARLKLCYVYGYHSCLQLYACTVPVLGDAPVVFLSCSIVLLQATMRSLALKKFRFCGGISDYGWSMWLVVASQFLTISVIAFAIGSRWLIHLAQFPKRSKYGGLYETYLQFQYLFSLNNLPKFVEKTFRFDIYSPLFYFHVVLVALTLIAHSLFTLPLTSYNFLSCVVAEFRPSSNYGGFLVTSEQICDRSRWFNQKLSSRNVVVVNWVLNKAVADMEIWMEMNERVTLKHLTRLLSTVSPSRESFYYVGLHGEGIRISLLSLMLLVEMEKAVKLTTQDRVSLSKVLNEVFEIVFFIGKKVNIGSSEDRLEFMVAAVTQKYGLANGLGEFILQQNSDLENCRVEFSFMIKHGCYPLIDSVTFCIRKVTSQVNDIISYRSDESSEAVHDRIEQVFVDMLQAFLAEHPAAVFAHIKEGPVEEYQERVKLGLSLMCKLQAIQSHVRFSLPSGTGITNLFNTQSSSTVTEAQGTQLQEVSTARRNIVPAVEDVGEIQDGAQTTEEHV